MMRTKRQLAAGLMIAGLVGAGRPVLAAATDASRISRLRSSTPALVRLMAEAAAQSETFRSLIETIDASDGIVYVEEGKCGHGVRACFVAVSEAGPNRLLRVVVDTRKADWDLMGSIGHELRHTIEVLSEPGVGRRREQRGPSHFSGGQMSGIASRLSRRWTLTSSRSTVMTVKLPSRQKPGVRLKPHTHPRPGR